MVNKENIEKKILKIESVLGFILASKIVVAFLDWFKIKIAESPAFLNETMIGCAIILTIIFLMFSWKKTHRLAVHACMLHGCICSYIHFSSMLKSGAWLIAIMMLIMLIFTDLYYKKNKNNDDTIFEDIGIFLIWLILLGGTQICYTIES